jgi:hypothetical protein
MTDIVTVLVRPHSKKARRKMRAVAGLVALLITLAVPRVTIAHNAGHIFLPGGTCLEIGSFRSAPLVGQDRTQLDLVPQTPNPPFDEYGVSFVGFGGNTPIRPGPCGAPPMTAAATDPWSANNEIDLWISQGFNGE